MPMLSRFCPASTRVVTPRIIGPLPLPALLAATPWVFGGQFWAMRVSNALAMAGAVALADAFCLRAAGILPAVKCVLFCCSIMPHPLGLAVADRVPWDSLCVAVMALLLQSDYPGGHITRGLDAIVDDVYQGVRRLESPSGT
jgi:hypothetical protein